MSFWFSISAKARSASQQTNAWSSSTLNFNDIKMLDPRLRGDDDIIHHGVTTLLSVVLGSFRGK